MRGAVYFAAAGLVAASAFWTYRINYQAKATLVRIEEVRHQIVTAREALVVLEAEWAWLNAPARLEELGRDHATALELDPMLGDHYASFADLPAPPPETFWVRADPEILARFSATRLAENLSVTGLP